jgi:hypothetical protein
MTDAALISRAIYRAQREILADRNDGTVPPDVASFAALHDYVDANEYGGLCDDDLFDALSPHANEIQGSLDAWIKSGALLTVGLA